MAIFVPLFLGATTFMRFFDLIVIEAVIAFVLLYFSGFIFNAITDYEYDKSYKTFKKKIPEAVDVLGMKTLWFVVLFHVSISLLLSLHISWQMQEWRLLFLLLVGVFFGLGYSAHPFSFKTRGIFHAISLAFSAFFLPFLFLVWVVAGEVTLLPFLFILGFTLMHYGMEFGNQAIDYLEDLHNDLRTPPVRWGLRRSMAVSLGCMVFGFGLELLVIFEMTMENTILVERFEYLTQMRLFILLAAILIIGYIVPLRGLWKMYNLSIVPNTENVMPLMHKICKYARWQIFGISGIFAVTGILFLSNFVEISSNKHTFVPTNPDLEFSGSSSVFFFQEDGQWFANVTTNVLNVGDGQIEVGNARLFFTSSYGGQNLDYKIIELGKVLEPGSKWAVTSTILAHDQDDTSITMGLQLRGQGNWSLLEHNVHKSQNDIYIFDTDKSIRNEHLMDRVNITVEIFNEGRVRENGQVRIVLMTYLNQIPVGTYSVSNNHSIGSDSFWTKYFTIEASQQLVFQLLLLVDDNIIDQVFVT